RRGRSDVSAGASGHHRCGAPCDAAGQWSAMSSGQRRRAPSLPRIAAAGGPWARSVGGGLLPDVEPRAFSRHPATSGGAGGDLPPCAWALRRVLERFPRLLWTRLAREVLFLSHGPRPLVDGAALCGIESGSRRNGGGGGGMAVVQRRGPWWSGGPGRLPGNGNVAPGVVGGPLAELPGGGRNRSRAAGVSSQYLHRTTAGDGGVYGGARTADPAPLDARPPRSSPENAGKSGTGTIYTKWGIRLTQVTPICGGFGFRAPGVR